MIRFCDKEVFVISEEMAEQVSRSDLLHFFIQNDTMQIIMIVDDENHVQGTIAYDRVLRYHEKKEYILEKTFKISEGFWTEAKLFFEQHPSALVPVVNDWGGVLGFCYQGRGEEDRLLEVLERLEKHMGDSLFIQELYPKIRQVCIMDCNELAYRIYALCRKKGIPICVVGEKWEWFSITSYEGFLDCPEYEKFYIYAEGNSIRREEKEYESNRYGSVSSSFEFLKDIADKNQIKLKQSKIEELESKGASVLSLVIPQEAEVRIRTKAELESYRYGVSFSEYVNAYDYISEQKRNIAESIYGKETCEYYRNGGEDKKTFINFGRFPCFYIRDNLSEKKIYVIGPCIVEGNLQMPSECLVAKLQEKVEKDGYTVIGCVILWHEYDLWEMVEDLPIRKQDIVICVDERNRTPEKGKGRAVYLDSLELYNRLERKTWYAGAAPIHVNADGVDALSDFLYYMYLRKEIEKKNNLPEREKRHCLQQGRILSMEQTAAIASYINEIGIPDKNEWQKIGAIIMNGNPFTLGHKYLVEYAASQVDMLYLFIVQEDRSHFPFSARFAMAAAGVSHLKNVKVVPSGDFVLSYKTLPAYFEKEVYREIKLNAAVDLEIFAHYIAPELGIKWRFVGEEPNDRITRQYNEQMKTILKENGINVVEICRKESLGEPISASRFRELFFGGNMEESMKLVPQTTWKILLEYKC